MTLSTYIQCLFKFDNIDDFNSPIVNFSLPRQQHSNFLSLWPVSLNLNMVGPVRVIETLSEDICLYRSTCTRYSVSVCQLGRDIYELFGVSILDVSNIPDLTRGVHDGYRMSSKRCSFFRNIWSSHLIMSEVHVLPLQFIVSDFFMDFECCFCDIGFVLRFFRPNFSQEA